MKKDLLRIIDANLNRSREGLRVCEEITRFILADSKLTKEYRNLRHNISRSINKLPGVSSALLKCRNSQSDIGKKIFNANKRKSYDDVFFANIQRVKESLRVLEEFSKIFNQRISSNFTRLRFKVYQLEKMTQKHKMFTQKREK